jgi:hypothetical protein
MTFTSDTFFIVFILLVALGLFVGMIVLLEVGRRIGIHRMRKDPEAARAGFGAAEGAIFALLGLLIAFTFSGAAERFDQRRHLIVEETNAIGKPTCVLTSSRQTCNRRFATRSGDI